METDCPECFGKAASSGQLSRCKSCEFQESCAFCARDDGRSCERRLGHVSYEKFSYSEKVAAPAESREEPEASFCSSGSDETRRIMEFLLDIDNYTAELVSDVLHGGVSTTSELARMRGISRQAVHRKIVDCCTLHPELRKLFITRLYRCRRILQDSKRLKARENPDQMEFNF